MNTAQQKATITRLFDEVINKRNVALMESAMSNTGANNEDAAPQHLNQSIGRFLRAFPDIRVTVEDCIGEGDKVVVRSSWVGTHNGPWGDCAATGKPVAFQRVDIFRIANGTIAEHWGINDGMAIMRQIGKR